MFVSIKNSDEGDLTIRFELPRIPTFPSKFHLRKWLLSHLVSKLLRATSFVSKQYYVILMGLGLGIGISMSSVVLNNPISARATPLVISDEIGVVPQRIGFGSSLNTLTSSSDTIDSVLLTPLSNWRDIRWIFSDQIYHYQNSSLLHQSAGPMVFLIGSNSVLYSDFADLTLGESIEITGKNNGVYQFVGIEVREVSFDEIGSIFTMTDQFANKAVFVFKSPGVSSSFTLILANKQ